MLFSPAVGPLFCHSSRRSGSQASLPCRRQSSSIDRSSGFLSFSPASSNLALFAQTVGFSWSCVRSTASLRLRTLFHVLRDQSTRTTHSVSPELVCSGSSLLSKQLQHCLSAELFRFSLLFQLHFVVVYSAVLADSTSGTSDTTAWSSVHGRCSRSTVEVLYNNAVCCLSPLSFWSLGLYHSVVPEVFNTTSVVVVRGKTSCVPSPSSLALLLRGGHPRKAISLFVSCTRASPRL